MTKLKKNGQPNYESVAILILIMAIIIFNRKSTEIAKRVVIETILGHIEFEKILQNECGTFLHNVLLSYIVAGMPVILETKQ